jgi:hypothetical protein
LFAEIALTDEVSAGIDRILTADVNGRTRPLCCNSLRVHRAAEQSARVDVLNAFFHDNGFEKYQGKPFYP